MLEKEIFERESIWETECRRIVGIINMIRIFYTKFTRNTLAEQKLFRYKVFQGVRYSFKWEHVQHYRVLLFVRVLTMNWLIWAEWVSTATLWPGWEGGREGGMGPVRDSRGWRGRTRGGHVDFLPGTNSLLKLKPTSLTKTWDTRVLTQLHFDGPSPRFLLSNGMHL